MTHNQQRTVKKWLYGINRRELAIVNLSQALIDIEQVLEHLPSFMVGVKPLSNSGRGGEQISTPEIYVLYREQIKTRFQKLEQLQIDHQRKIQMYKTALDQLEAEIGRDAKVLIEKKYYARIRPDRAIYTMWLFCSKAQFYRVHNEALQFLFDVLPSEFAWTNNERDSRETIIDNITDNIYIGKYLLSESELECYGK